MAALYVVTVFLIVCRRRRRSSSSPSSSPVNNKYGYNGIHKQEHGNENGNGNEDFNEMTANEIHNGKKDLETSFDESNYTSSSTASPPNDSLNNNISGSDDNDDDEVDDDDDNLNLHPPSRLSSSRRLQQTETDSDGYVCSTLFSSFVLFVIIKLLTSITIVIIISVCFEHFIPSASLDRDNTVVNDQVRRKKVARSRVREESIMQ
mmetsp:Transcript_4662/g.6833  ORF Transcript_4662/g.6833 Transcript_4662/m.6833 type:complete len:206 (+) Transcript_4662:138-755(+)